jgi:hypothetical protein
MFVLVVVLLMFVLPLGCTAVELAQYGAHLSILLVLGKWSVFWGIGVRLFTAGMRQIIKPGLTSEGILGISGEKVWILVRELGAANVGIGLVAIVSLWKTAWQSPAALAGGLFLGFAGILHGANKHREIEENLAMYSDLFVAAIVLVFFFKSF